MKKVFCLLWLFFALPLFVEAADLTESDLQALVGKEIVLKVNVPGGTKGFNILCENDGQCGWDTAPDGELNRYLYHSGYSYKAGDIATITKVVLKGKHIEVHLDRGGTNDGMSPLEAFGPRVNVNGGRFNLRFRDDLKKLGVDLEQVVEILKLAAAFPDEGEKVSEADTAQAREQLERLELRYQQVVASAEAVRSANSQSQTLASNYEKAQYSEQEMRDALPANLRNSREALSALKFFFGHAARDFDMVSTSVLQYEAMRQKISTQYMDRQIESMMEQQLAPHRGMFEKRQGPFFVTSPGRSGFNMPLQELVSAGATVRVEAIKQGQITAQTYMTGRVDNYAFLRVDYEPNQPLRIKDMNICYLGFRVPVNQGYVSVSPMLRGLMSGPPGALPRVELIDLKYCGR